MGSTAMYRDLARYYDRIYGEKDYRGDTRRLVAVARRYARRRPRSWLDVACGTGRHLELLRGRFEVAGVDLSPEMLRIARRRLPGVRLVRADMRSFELRRSYDVVSCLFSAIGYLRTEADVARAFRTFADHLSPGGVIIVQPWIAPAQFRPGHVALDAYRDPTTKIARMGTVVRRGAFARIRFYYLFGEEGRGVRFVREDEELRMIAPRRLRALLARAGVRTRWLPPAPGRPGDRGLLVGVNEGER